MAKATLTTLASFNGANGPHAGLIADAAGDLFGTTEGGGAYGDGAVFEIAKTGDGYAGAPTVLASFDGADGNGPVAGLIADAAGDLFGTTFDGGAYGHGGVYEIAKTRDGYASTPTVLASFDGADGAGPLAGLIADAAGDLFGTTDGGGAYGYGAVFEIAKTSDGYAGTPTVLASFDLADGGGPSAGLIADAAGNLFGTTVYGGAHGKGEVFEIARTSDGYASTPTVLARFDSGVYLYAGLIADAAGNLYGTTESGGAYNYGEVFEIAKTSDGYASKPKVLASFDGADGAGPVAGLIADAAGNLFGTTWFGGAYGYGTVFEIAKTSDGYAGTPTVLASFNASKGRYPYAGLIADSAGNLFGTTAGGGAYGDGAVFELSGAGFQTTVDLSSLGYKSSYEAVWRPATHLLKIIDTADADAIVATLSIAGTLTGELVTLGSDSGTGTEVGFTANPLVSVEPGDVLVSKVSGFRYSAYERIYQDGTFDGRVNFITGVMGRNYASEAVRFGADGTRETTLAADTNGTYTLKGHEDGLTLEATRNNETLIGGGVRETFSFSTAFVNDTLGDFASHLTGPDADILSLPAGAFNDSFTQLLAATTFTSSGAAIPLTRYDKIHIPGLTETAMAANSADFTFHA